MYTISLNNNFDRIYSNNGQHAEQVFAYTLTSEITKASNLEHSKGGDVLNFQVKSARATVCKGTNLKAYLDLDGATEYAYINSDFTKAYIMNRKEYENFVNEFATITYESHKNGGGAKLRLKSESKAMVEWLESH